MTFQQVEAKAVTTANISWLSVFLPTSRYTHRASSIHSMRLPLLSIAITGICAVVAQEPASADLRLGPIAFAGYENYVYRDNITNVQAVVSR